ncbi:hypothetical protein ANANG_G00153140 [Anguilla anguilla]|uniref:Uncharacterized protein n=1 Tax=Anguilla anguilla TaxID=7936 RepID=A0A9D3M707_ANGAN|nr:hypothetical protein ANANG_G00153140 [Anguilla anguilla]
MPGPPMPLVGEDAYDSGCHTVSHFKRGKDFEPKHCGKADSCGELPVSYHRDPPFPPPSPPGRTSSDSSGRATEPEISCGGVTGK